MVIKPATRGADPKHSFRSAVPAPMQNSGTETFGGCEVLVAIDAPERREDKI